MTTTTPTAIASQILRRTHSEPELNGMDKRKLAIVRSSSLNGIVKSSDNLPSKSNPTGQRWISEALPGVKPGLMEGVSKADAPSSARVSETRTPEMRFKCYLQLRRQIKEQTTYFNEKIYPMGNSAQTTKVDQLLSQAIDYVNSEIVPALGRARDKHSPVNPKERDKLYVKELAVLFERNGGIVSDLEKMVADLNSAVNELDTCVNAEPKSPSELEIDGDGYVSGPISAEDKPIVVQPDASKKPVKGAEDVSRAGLIEMGYRQQPISAENCLCWMRSAFTVLLNSVDQNVFDRALKALFEKEDVSNETFNIKQALNDFEHDKFSPSIEYKMLCITEQILKNEGVLHSKISDEKVNKDKLQEDLGPIEFDALGIDDKEECLTFGQVINIQKVLNRKGKATIGAPMGNDAMIYPLFKTFGLTLHLQGQQRGREAPITQYQARNERNNVFVLNAENKPRFIISHAYSHFEIYEFSKDTLEEKEAVEEKKSVGAVFKTLLVSLLLQQLLKKQ